MSIPQSGLTLCAVTTTACLWALAATPAPAADDTPLSSAATALRAPVLGPRQDRVPTIAPVAEPVSIDPAAGGARGTMIMVHGGGWAGHSGPARDQLLKNPGSLFVARGWRVVSIDYSEGGAGLQDVLDAAGTELARKSSDGPLCMYGESAGAHLAILAAARLPAVDCVIGVGTPTDLVLYQAEAAASSDGRVHLAASQIKRFFGSTFAETAPWELAPVAAGIRADIMLVREADDAIVTPAHAANFQAARPTTQIIDIEAGDARDPSTSFIHGTASAIGRARYASALGSFADRTVAARDAERLARRTGCPRVTRSLAQAGPAGLRNALRCLARRTSGRRPVIGAWQQTSVTVRGEVNAARIWASLRGFSSGRSALAATAARRARVIVKPGERSRVTFRATRR